MKNGRFALQKYGGYLLVNRLVNNGGTELWLACRYVQKKFQNFCAVKRVVIRKSSDNSMREKFLQEGQTNFLLRHPNIVTCVDYGWLKSDEEESVYIVMDYIFGKNLTQIQRDQTKDLKQGADPAFIVQTVCSIAGAIDYMHQFQNPYTLKLEPIIHRDISPANIMISYAGEVKVLDFGIAIRRGNNSPINKSAGKITYMSPEQLVGHELSACSDIYSLGVVFWELLCGQKLFEKKGDRDRQIVHSSGIIMHPSKINPKIDERLGDICMKCLQPEPKDRFAQASDFYDALWTTYKDTINGNCLQEYMLHSFSDDFKEGRKFLETIEQSPYCDAGLFEKVRRCADAKRSCINNEDVTLTAEDFSVTRTNLEYKKSSETNMPLSVEETQTITL